MDTNYSILVSVTFPDIENTYDMHIPVTKSVAFICKLFQKFIGETLNTNYEIKDSVVLINMRTGEEYDMNKLVIDTTIKNGTKLLLY